MSSLENGQTFQTPLPDGKEFVSPNNIQAAIVEGHLAASTEFPVAFEELGQYVFGDDFSIQKKGDELRTHIHDVNRRLRTEGWRISFDGEGKSWIEEHNVSLTTEQPSEPTALVTLNTLGEAIMAKLTPVDKDTLVEDAQLNPLSFAASVEVFRENVQAFRDGELTPPNPSAIIEEEDVDDKVGLVRRNLEALISLSVTDPNNRAVKTIQSWGRNLNEFKLLLGGGPIGTELLYEAISTLDSVSQAVLLSQMSSWQRYQIMLVGINQVNEREMSSFINNSVFARHLRGEHSDEPDDQLIQMIHAIEERHLSSSERFDAGKVIEALFTYHKYGADYVLNQLIQLAEEYNMEADLIVLFSSSPLTRTYAEKVSETFYGLSPKELDALDWEAMDGEDE